MNRIFPGKKKDHHNTDDPLFYPWGPGPNVIQCSLESNLLNCSAVIDALRAAHHRLFRENYSAFFLITSEELSDLDTDLKKL